MIMGGVNSEKKLFCGKEENNIINFFFYNNVVLKGAIEACHHHEYSLSRYEEEAVIVSKT